MESRKRKMLQDRGKSPEHEGDAIGEKKAMHGREFPEQLVEGRWERQERKMEVDKDTKEETGKKGIREEEKEENETVMVKRRCVNPVSAEALDILSQSEVSESCGTSWGDFGDESGGLSDCDSGTWTGLSFFGGG